MSNMSRFGYAFVQCALFSVIGPGPAAVRCLDKQPMFRHENGMAGMSEATKDEMQSARPLSGARGWLITDGKAGMIVPVRGIADTLGLISEEKTVAPTGIWRVLAPWGPVAPRERPGHPSSQFQPPWPDVAIATGRASIPYLRAVKAAAGPRCFTFVMQDPKTGASTADLIWVSEHDKLRGDNVIVTLAAPNSLSETWLNTTRSTAPPDITALPHPRVAVVLGGKNAVYKFRDEDDARLDRSLRAIAAHGASFMITTSRRTHDRLLQVVENATRNAPRQLWRGPQDGHNPYPAMLAYADHIIVTADSVNMTSEACATGRPVYVFFPSGGSAKFSHYHRRLEELGATRPLPDHIEQLAVWHYAPIRSADYIAREIEHRWAAKQLLCKERGLET